MLSNIPYSTTLVGENFVVDLVVDSQSAKVLPTNVFFHHGFVQAVAIAK